MDEGGRRPRAEQPEGRKSDAKNIDTERAAEVHPDDPTRAPGHSNRLRKTDQVVSEQHHIRTLLRHIGARPHGNAHGCGGECWRIIHAVADHRNYPTLCYQGLNACEFVLG